MTTETLDVLEPTAAEAAAPPAAGKPTGTVRVGIIDGSTFVNLFNARLHDDGTAVRAFHAEIARRVKDACGAARDQFLAGEQYRELQTYRGFLLQREHDLEHAEEYVKARQAIYEQSLNSAATGPQDHDDLHRAKERRDLAKDARDRTKALVDGKAKDAADSLRRAAAAAAAALAVEAHGRHEALTAECLAALFGFAPGLAAESYLSAPTNFESEVSQYRALPD